MIFWTRLADFRFSYISPLEKLFKEKNSEKWERKKKESWKKRRKEKKTILESWEEIQKKDGKTRVNV